MVKEVKRSLRAFLLRLVVSTLFCWVGQDLLLFCNSWGANYLKYTLADVELSPHLNSRLNRSLQSFGKFHQNCTYLMHI